jgi:ribosomal protein S6--L-glutamate ligase
MVGHHPFVFEFNRLFGNQGLAGLQNKVDDAIQSYLLKHWGDNDPHNPLSPELLPQLPQAV